MAARLKEKYQKDVAPQIAKEFGIKNPMAVPRLEKIVVNMGMGEAIANAKILDTAADELRAITGQKPVGTKAKNSIASCKLRQGMPIGLRVTLGGDRSMSFWNAWARSRCAALGTFAPFRQRHLMAEAITQL